LNSRNYEDDERGSEKTSVARTRWSKDFFLRYKGSSSRGLIWISNIQIESDKE
jgi:hypothetical protein